MSCGARSQRVHGGAARRGSSAAGNRLLLRAAAARHERRSAIRCSPARQARRRLRTRDRQRRPPGRRRGGGGGGGATRGAPPIAAAALGGRHRRALLGQASRQEEAESSSRSGCRAGFYPVARDAILSAPSRRPAAARARGELRMERRAPCVLTRSTSSKFGSLENPDLKPSFAALRDYDYPRASSAASSSAARRPRRRAALRSPSARMTTCAISRRTSAASATTRTTSRCTSRPRSSSGLVATTVAAPFDLLKSRVMASDLPTDTATVLARLLRKEGPAALFNGWLPTYRASARTPASPSLCSRRCERRSGWSTCNFGVLRDNVGPACAARYFTTNPSCDACGRRAPPRGAPRRPRRRRTAA